MSVFLKIDQSDSKVNLIYPKWPQSGPWVRKMIPKRPQSHPKMTRLARSQTFFGVLVASVTSKILCKNEYNLLMDPFGPDTKRHDMHYMCHSTSICHFWDPFFTFEPLSSIIFMKIAPKVTPRWPRSYIKSLKSIGKMNVFENGPKWLQSKPHIPKMTAKWPMSAQNEPKTTPKSPQNDPARSVANFL